MNNNNSAPQAWEKTKENIFAAKRTRSAVFGLAISCPFFKSSSECPLKEVRKMCSRDIYEWLEKSDDEELDKIVKEHQHCFSCRRYS